MNSIKDLESARFLSHLEEGLKCLQEEVLNKSLTKEGVEAWINHLPVRTGSEEDWNEEVYKTATKMLDILYTYSEERGFNIPHS